MELVASISDNVLNIYCWFFAFIAWTVLVAFVAYLLGTEDGEDRIAREIDRRWRAHRNGRPSDE